MFDVHSDQNQKKILKWSQKIISHLFSLIVYKQVILYDPANLRGAELKDEFTQSWKDTNTHKHGPQLKCKLAWKTTN